MNLKKLDDLAAGLMTTEPQRGGLLANAAEKFRAAARLVEQAGYTTDQVLGVSEAKLAAAAMPSHPAASVEGMSAAVAAKPSSQPAPSAPTVDPKAAAAAAHMAPTT